MDPAVLLLSGKEVLKLFISVFRWRFSICVRFTKRSFALTDRTVLIMRINPQLNASEPIAESVALVNLSLNHDNKRVRPIEKAFHDSSSVLYPQKPIPVEWNFRNTSQGGSILEDQSQDITSASLDLVEKANLPGEYVVVEFEPLMEAPLLNYSHDPFDFSCLPPSKPTWTLAGPFCDTQVAPTADESILLHYLQSEQTLLKSKNYSWWMYVRSLLFDVSEEIYYRLYPVATIFHESDSVFVEVLRSSL